MVLLIFKSNKNSTVLLLIMYQHIFWIQKDYIAKLFDSYCGHIDRVQNDC